MKGCLIVNSYINSQKFSTIYSQLCCAFAQQGVELYIHNNISAQQLVLQPLQYDFVIFWDKDIALARLLEKTGYRLFNNSSAIEICNNKMSTYIALVGKIDMPHTISAPHNFALNNSQVTQQWLDQCVKQLGFPLIVKQCCGSFGLEVYLADNMQQLQQLSNQLVDKEYLLQYFVSSSRGSDIRVQVVGGKVVACVKRTAKDDFRANATLGATMTQYQPSQAIIDMALTSCKLLCLDWAGVDILLDNGKPLLCEVNSNAHFVNIGKATNVDIAMCIAQHVIDTVS